MRENRLDRARQREPERLVGVEVRVVRLPLDHRARGPLARWPSSELKWIAMKQAACTSAATAARFVKSRFTSASRVRTTFTCPLFAAVAGLDPRGDEPGKLEREVFFEKMMGDARGVVARALVVRGIGAGVVAPPWPGSMTMTRGNGAASADHGARPAAHSTGEKEAVDGPALCHGGEEARSRKICTEVSATIPRASTRTSLPNARNRSLMPGGHVRQQRGERRGVAAGLRHDAAPGIAHGQIPLLGRAHDAEAILHAAHHRQVAVRPAVQVEVPRGHQQHSAPAAPYWRAGFVKSRSLQIMTARVFDSGRESEDAAG